MATKGFTLSTRATSRIALICIAILLQVPASNAQAPKNPAHEHEQATTNPPSDMSAKCQAMMAGREKMMAQTKAADQRLDSLVAKMSAASGQAKQDAIGAVEMEMVTQRKTMRDGMMKMDEGMMNHMMEHMQAGPQSMAMCPMMKMGAMKH